ncbi:hypothetical protein [Actibacterium mucosum]|nr:hypothetical protein [Actibacterium mucosum]
MFRLLLCALTLLPFAAMAQDRFSVPLGSEVLIGQYTGWTSKCAVRRTTVKVLDKPSLGTIKLRRAKVAVPKTATVGDLPSDCIGKLLRGVHIYYLADQGQTGRDEVTFRLQYQGVSGSSTRRVIVTVR